MARSAHARPPAVLCAADDEAAVPNLRDAHAVLEAHADIRAIVAWRQGVDFVNSRLRSRPKADFISHCRLWTMAMREMEALHKAHPERVLRVEQRQLRREPLEIAIALERFLKRGGFRADRVAEVLVNEQPGRSVAMTDAPVRDPALTGWAMAEIDVFLDICGSLCQLDGRASLAAERRRPLDLSRCLLDRSRGLGGAHIDEQEHAGPPIVSFTPDRLGGPSPALNLSCVAAGHRRHLQLGLTVLVCDGIGEGRCEIVESRSRRPLFAAPLVLSTGVPFVAQCRLPPHDGLLDFSLGHMSGSFERCQIAVDMARLALE